MFMTKVINNDPKGECRGTEYMASLDIIGEGGACTIKTVSWTALDEATNNDAYKLYQSLYNEFLEQQKAEKQAESTRLIEMKSNAVAERMKSLSLSQPQIDIIEDVKSSIEFNADHINWYIGQVIKAFKTIDVKLPDPLAIKKYLEQP